MGLLRMSLACAQRSEPVVVPPPVMHIEVAFVPSARAPLELPVYTEVVKRTMRRHASRQWRACYLSRLRHNSSLGGRVELGFWVEAGRVKRVWTALNTTGDDALAECMVSTVMRWRFNDGHTGEYASPVTLRPEG